jgi:soluble lytic murein transglycosylase
MSSMLRASTLLLLATTACVSTPAQCQEGREWDLAKARLMQSHDMGMHQAVDRWRQLSASSSMPFGSYSSFLITYPGFPQEERLRGYAEKALERESPDAGTLVAFFDKFPPLSSMAAGRYATALTLTGRKDAKEKAIEAWRMGGLAPNDEATIMTYYGRDLDRKDHDARMDALLWQGETAQAERQVSFVSPDARNWFMERLALAQGSGPGSLGISLDADAMRDPGYVYNRVVQARKSGNLGSAINLLANRPPLEEPVPEPEKWVKERLTAARGAGADPAVRIASQIDDAFAPGTDISKLSYRLRDDYTSLMWLGGTKALWDLRDPRRAAPLFYRYGAAAQTPGTRSKGFYWAGRAMAQAGDRGEAERYFALAAEYPEYFYGQLSLERLGKPLPNLDVTPDARPSQSEAQEFAAKPITNAVREVARDADWRTTVQFFREISDQAQSEKDHVLVADLAREIGRRDLGVILGQNAHAEGHTEFGKIAFPTLVTPPGSNWIMVHALSRQESQFAQNAVSHAGASGLMQLMPGTAREQAGKLGLSYNQSALISDPTYNIQLGNGYFARMMDYYGGSYPLAVAAYNAGPGNVNKWLRANGDPRTGSVEWVDWIERIPIYETKNYVQRVLENAVVYEALYPERGFYKGDNPLSRYLGKRTPG